LEARFDPDLRLGALLRGWEAELRTCRLTPVFAFCDTLLTAAGSFLMLVRFGSLSVPFSDFAATSAPTTPPIAAPTGPPTTAPTTAPATAPAGFFGMRISEVAFGSWSDAVGFLGCDFIVSFPALCVTRTFTSSGLSSALCWLAQRASKSFRPAIHAKGRNHDRQSGAATKPDVRRDRRLLRL